MTTLTLVLFAIGGFAVGVAGTAALMIQHLKEKRQILLNRLGALHRQARHHVHQAKGSDDHNARAYHQGYANALNNLALELTETKPWAPPAPTPEQETPNMTDLPPVQNPEAIPALLEASSRLACALSDNIAISIDPKLRDGESNAAWDTEILANYANAYAAVYGRLWWPSQQSVSALFARNRAPPYHERINSGSIHEAAQEAWDSARKEVPA